MYILQTKILESDGLTFTSSSMCMTTTIGEGGCAIIEIKNKEREVMFLSK